MTRLLFVYGSLLTAICSQIATYLRKNSHPQGPGQVPGYLFDLGRYPGLVYDPEAPKMVAGQVLELLEPEAVLQVLDDYEMIIPENPELNEYRREQGRVITEKGIRTCWMYLYNRPTEGLKPIPSGNYLDYLPGNPAHQQFLDSV